MDRLPDEDLLTTREVARRKSVTARVIQKAASRGEIVPVQAGRGTKPHLFRRADVDAWAPPCERPRKRYSDEELLGWLRRAEDILGHPPTPAEMTSMSPPYPPVSTYIRRFGTWRAAMDQAFGDRS